MTSVTSVDRQFVSGHNGPMRRGTSGQQVQIIAHRGASSQRPENTVEAFRRAGVLGADAVELDVRSTADEVLVVHHDAVLADGRALAETRRDDLPGDIPTLTEALDACEGMWVNVEIKHDPSEPGFDPREAIAYATAALLARRPEPLSRWLVSSFRRETIDAVHAAEPELATAWLCLTLDASTAASLARDGHVAAHPWVEGLTPEVIAACHAVGLRVNVWTCDDPDRMKQLIAAGVDGLCTNVPDVGRQVRDTGITSRSTSGS